MEPQIKRGLDAALLVAQRAAQTVGKDKKNEHHGYRYASAEAVIAESRQALLAAGLVHTACSWKFVLSEAEEREFLSSYSEKGPSSSFVGVMRVSHVLAHPESGESRSWEVESPVLLERGRPLDKAEAGALSYNMSYFLRGLLLLPRQDEDTDIDRRDDRGASPRGERQDRRQDRRREPDPIPPGETDLSRQLRAQIEQHLGDAAQVLPAKALEGWRKAFAEKGHDVGKLRALYEALGKVIAKARADAEKAKAAPAPVEQKTETKTEPPAERGEPGIEG